MACPSCATEHAPEARFCSACGASLRVACPTCGAEQLADAAFCSACGTALRDGVRRAAAAPGADERRVVSLLFADLAGSTALGGRLDPEDVRAVQQDLYQLVAERVEAFGGVTEKFAGDAVLAVFGIPQAHEDDAARAVLAGLAVRDAFGSFAEHVRKRHGAEVGVRIGVNTGEVVSGREAASRGEMMVSGDAVNVAARLQQAAEPGEVLVADRTSAAAQGAVHFDEVRTVAAKGKADGLRAWPARAAADGGAKRGVPGLHAPLIGRDEELTLLSTLARRVQRERVPQLVTLFGAAGVGKSRLLREFASTQPDARVLVGRCLPYGEGVTWWPLAEIVKDHAGILESDPAPIARVKLAAALMPLGDESLLDAVSYTIGIEEPGSRIASVDGIDVRRALVREWTRYLRELGRERLTLVVIEDIHWASTPLLDLIEHVGGALDDTSVMILCPSRPELLDDRPSWGAGKRNATALTLSPLAAEEADRLVSSLLDLDHIGESMRRRIRERAEGNPFYTEEILRMLIDRGALAEKDGRWTAAERPDEFPIPDSVHGVIAARIDLLGADERRALRECAVVGREFWPGAVGADPAALEALARRELISERPESTVASERQFAFKHALTRDVAYGALPRVERRRLHVQVARWIEQVSAGREQEVSELVAHHYSEAVANGEDDPAVRERALDSLVSAGLAALRRSAAEPARAHLLRALDLAATERDKGRVEVSLGEAELWLNRIDDGVEHLERARARFDALGDPRLLAEALSWLSRAYWLASRQDEALAAGREAVTLLEGGEETPHLARALARRSQIEMLAALPQAVDHAREAVEMAQRVGDPWAEANARINLVSSSMFAGGAVVDDFIGAAHLALDCGAFEEAHRARVNYLWTAGPLLPLPDVVHALHGLSLPLIVTSAYAEYFDISYALFVDLPTGRWDLVDARLTDAGERVSHTATTTRMVWIQLAATVSLARGELGRAERLIEEGLRWADTTGEPQRVTPMRALAAWLAVFRGSPAAAVEHIRLARDNQRGRLASQFAAELTLAAGRILHRAGEVEALRAFRDDVGPEMAAAAGLRARTASLMLDGLLALSAGAAADARSHLQALVDCQEERGADYDREVSRLLLADALEQAGEPDAAGAARAAAGRLLAPLGVVNPL